MDNADVQGDRDFEKETGFKGLVVCQVVGRFLFLFVAVLIERPWSLFLLFDSPYNVSPLASSSSFARAFVYGVMRDNYQTKENNWYYKMLMQHRELT